MPYSYNRSGRLSFLPPVRQSRFSTTNNQPKSDLIRLPQIYVESVHDLEPGHLVAWTGEPHMFTESGSKKEQWTSEHGYEFALSRVELAPNNSNLIAGIVQEKAASPGQENFLQKGIHTIHKLPFKI